MIGEFPELQGIMGRYYALHDGEPAAIADAMRTQGLWDDEDGFFYDVLTMPGGERIPLRIRSLVGLLPLIATTSLDSDRLRALPSFRNDIEHFERLKPRLAAAVAQQHRHGDEQRAEDQ